MDEQAKVRYAVVGLGYIAQQAVLPAFKHAKNAELAALISSDDEKLKELSEKYGVRHTSNYENFEQCLRDADVDAVYIALPNDMHSEYTVRSARTGVHVLCEKPMALTLEECQEMRDACHLAGVKLMIAYRLHFDPANLEAIDIVRDSDFGAMRFFQSAFSMQVRDDENIRLQMERGGGPLFDLGIYAVNASRYLFRSEPMEVMAFMESGEDVRFKEVEEMVTAILRFPENKLASFTASFGAVDRSSYEVFGARGHLRVEPAYDYEQGIHLTLTVAGQSKTMRYRKEDQFAPLLIHFADCILEGREPAPNAIEGMADVQIMQAIRESAMTGRKVVLRRLERSVDRPASAHRMKIPPVKAPDLVNAVEPSQPRDEAKKTA